MTSDLDTMEIARLNAMQKSMLEMCDALIAERDAARAQVEGLQSALSAVSQRGIQRLRAQRAKDRSELESLREVNTVLLESQNNAIRAYQRLHSQVNDKSKVFDNTTFQRMG